MKHKKQHFVPRSYLAAWSDSSTPPGQAPYVWVFSKDSREGQKRAPKNIFSETDMYTITEPDGGRDLRLEHGLSELEDSFCRVRDQVLRRQKPLSKEDRTILCYFIAAMSGRTKAYRDFQREQWQRPLKMAESIMAWEETATDEERRRMSRMSAPHSDSPGMSYDDIRRIVKQPLQELLPSLISTTAPLLFRLDLAIFDAKCYPGFITSDDPCVWFDADAYKRPPMFRQPALMYETIEVGLPVAPWQMIVLNRKGIEGYFPLVDSNKIDQLNKRTFFHANDHFIACGSTTRDAWFTPDPDPEDSWDRLHGDESRFSEEGNSES